jgi:tetratricopeptide (TPR) repeat protein
VAATDLDAERTLLTQALDVRQRVLPANDLDLALTLGALAGHYRRRGDLERSRELYREAFAVFRDPSERRHPKAVSLMGAYAVLLGNVKAYDESEAVLREAIAVGEEVLGPGTLTVADLTNDLAVIMTTRGRLDAAEHTFRDSFDRHVALFGENHWRVRNIARNIGQVLTIQQRYEAALPWMDRAVAIRADATSSDYAGLEGIRAQRSWIVFRLGRRSEALEAVTRAVSALEGTKDSNDGFALAFSRILLARILSETGRPAEAETAARAAMVWFERWGRSHPKYADAECEVGRAQLLQGRTSDGWAILERCLSIYRGWGQADPYVVKSLDQALAGNR